MGHANTLRELIHRDKIVLAPGCGDALSAKIAAKNGAECLYISGNYAGTTIHGAPDIGLTTMTEMTRKARQITGAVDLPLICDADTGYGNPLNTIRTVQEFERAGVAGIHIEDQQVPKKCGHFEGKRLHSTDEMCAKINAATDAQINDDFVIIARTDAVAINGISDAIDRSKHYAAAGADMIFIDAPESLDHLETIGTELSDIPLLTNIPFGGKTPMIPASEAEGLGFDVMLFACTGQKATINILNEVYGTLLETGDEQNLLHLLADWEERNNATDFADWKELEHEYAT